MISAKRAIFATNKVGTKAIATKAARQPLLPLIGDAIKRHVFGIKA